MTREVFEKKRRDALIKYRALAESDLEQCRTAREINNAKRRIQLCIDKLNQINSGKFWDSLTECVFANVYQFYEDDWEVSPF